MKTTLRHILFFIAYIVTSVILAAEPDVAEHHYLYVALPGIRADLNVGGSGIAVFDIDNGHKFVRRIPTRPADAVGAPEAMKGVCANATTKKLYFSTPKSLTCIDLVTE